ncbi:MAG TPA: LLM class flavin-dependent oxidoreductase [Stellaceae bacterium]|nr:LLM class flavin-dependent oxidoreductase [Stellaceae bacterium]
MEFGIWDTTGPRERVTTADLYRQHFAELTLAETCGFHHYWFYEHHLSATGPVPSPNLMVAAAAQHTSQIRLGNMVTLLPVRNPLLVAEEMAMLDQMTGGRLDVGIGRGGKAAEYECFGLETANSRALFHESFELIRRIWADEIFEHQGPHFRIAKAAALSPVLVQRPHPPVYVTANSEESIRWAAERDFPFVQLDSMFEDCRRDQAFYREIQRAAGFAVRPRLCLTREVYVAPTDEQARREAKDYLMHYWNLWGRFTQFVKAGQVPASFESWYQRAPRLFSMSYEELIDAGLVLIGSPETVARQVRRHRDELDLAVFVGSFQLGGMPHDKVMSSLRAFGTEVMPRVMAETVTA